VEKYIQRVNSNGSNTRVTSGVITTYGTSSPLPTLAYTTETRSPITNFSALAISASGATLDTRYKPQIYFDGYDSYGNIIQQHNTNDISSAYIWDTTLHFLSLNASMQHQMKLPLLLLNGMAQETGLFLLLQETPLTP
jgi:hypothetical protein